jgi:flagellin-like hook-associated protein FlgL
MTFGIKNTTIPHLSFNITAANKEAKQVGKGISTNIKEGNPVDAFLGNNTKYAAIEQRSQTKNLTITTHMLSTAKNAYENIAKLLKDSIDIATRATSASDAQRTILESKLTTNISAIKDIINETKFDGKPLLSDDVDIGGGIKLAKIDEVEAQKLNDDAAINKAIKAVNDSFAAVSKQEAALETNQANLKSKIETMNKQVNVLEEIANTFLSVDVIDATAQYSELVKSIVASLTVIAQENILTKEALEHVKNSVRN